jgi:lysophospholipase L1-like esterase
MTEAPNRIATVGRRLGLIVFGLALSLVLLEGLLQAGAAYNRGALRGDAPAAVAVASRVVCVGDSNTFGITLPRDSTYPAFLQDLFRADPTTASVEVLNLGVPGTNSSLLRTRLGTIIDTFHPDTLLVMIGANDFWTIPVPVEDEATTWRQQLWAYSRVYRLFYMLARATRREELAPEVIVETPKGGKVRGVVRQGDQEIDLSWTGRADDDQVDWRDKLAVNLRAMAALAQRRGVQFVLLTYPAEGAAYGRANKVIRQAAPGLRFVDLGADFRRACPQLACPEIFLADLHPNKLGYQIAASLVWRALRDAKGSAPTLPDQLFPAAVPWLQRIDQAPPAQAAAATAP